MIVILINYANYIVNHFPIKNLSNITLEEAWTNIKLDVSHFCIFGSIAWAHIPDEKRKGLQLKIEKYIFVRYFEDVKAYTLIQPHSNIIIITRYVKIDSNVLVCTINLVVVPSSTYDPS